MGIKITFNTFLYVMLSGKQRILTKTLSFGNSRISSDIKLIKKLAYCFFTLNQHFVFLYLVHFLYYLS